ncbi:hypothetical protein ZIOFF_069793 [Zingiber officinale]|uniref:Zinc finger PHD-type domain-containing protein n=1 Tax=Zingiber officinale TaxID=94328 RepID=A0A8J5C4B5_ZINOF|nr:hypothetical protein ZIOFF_069793 [Zingiber officinale]
MALAGGTLASPPPDSVENGCGPTDLEDSVLRSGVRTGLKREFAFALKAQAQISISLGRTRSGNSRSAPAAVVSPRESKRMKKHASDLTAVASSHSPADPLMVVDSSASLDPVEPDANASIEGKTADSVNVVPMEQADAEGTPLTRDGKVQSAVDIHPPPLNSIILALGSCSSNKVKGVRRSSLIVPAEFEARGKIDNTSVSPQNLDSLVVSDNTHVDGSGKILDNEFIGSDCVEDLVMVDVADELEAGTSRTGSHVKITGPPSKGVSEESNIVSIPVLIMDEGGFPVGRCPDGIRIDNGSSKKTFVRRFTRSALKVTCTEHKETSVDSHITMNGHFSHKDSNSHVLSPMRRFTRSAAKGISSITSTSSSSSGSEDSKGIANAASCSSMLTPNKKMELKMSKKITSTKVPSNIRELLSTGLLEGLPVSYNASCGKHLALRGVIKGNGILCSCASCDGSIVVSAYVFEQHAHSTKKHPANFIFLPNGKSLHDIVKACASSPLDMLEARIQNAIGQVSSQGTFTCQKCKGPIITPAKFGNFCDSCLESQQPPRTPSPIHGSAFTKGLSKPVSVTSHADSSSKNLTSNKKTSLGRLTRKYLRHFPSFSHILARITLQGTEVGYYVRGKRLLEGYIKDSGICCQCCNSVVSPSQFEAHAGQALRRKPYNYIYTSNGVSLHELSVSLAKDRKTIASDSDDLCSICADGGNLVLCDLCPRAFHKGRNGLSNIGYRFGNRIVFIDNGGIGTNLCWTREMKKAKCIGLSSAPKGDWHCRYCQSLHQREKCLSSNKNAIAAGRVAGVDPIEQIFKRCIRIVTTTLTDDSSCSLCRCHDFSRGGFNDRTVIICDQCEREYHVGCLRDHKMADLKELPLGEWFCCTDCIRMRSALEEYLHRRAELLPSSNMDILKRKCDSRGLDKNLDTDIRWRLLSGRALEADSKLLLSRAVTIFHESFDPIVEASTGKDLIPSMVYGRSVKGQDFAGMYCPVLIVGSCVVSAGLLRFLGRDVAELPLVATSREHQGQGYFQSLFSCIERFLASLGVRHIVLPAAEEAESIWTNKFGFTKISTDQLETYLQGAHATSFHGTTMLCKSIPVSMFLSQGDKR